MFRSEWELRRDIIKTGKKVYEKGFVAATDGNISVRVMNDRMLITPTGYALDSMTVEDPVYVNFDGDILSGVNRPSSELPMHIEIYRQRKDVSAIVHTHAPLATAFSVAGESLVDPVLPEIVAMYGSIPIAPYATPSTPENAEVIREPIREHDIVILDHHGAVTVGKDLQDALQKMEKLELAARTLLAAKQLGRINKLNPEQIQKLRLLAYSK
jgi:L-fuculose-phosphate aldolase